MAMSLLAACAPEWNWRSMTMAPHGWQQEWPCKPDRIEHQVSGMQAGEQWPAHWWRCQSGGATFEAMAVELPDAAQAAQALQRWQAAVASAGAAAAWQRHEATWHGATPYRGSGWWHSPGRNGESGPQWAGWGGRGPVLVRLQVSGLADGEQARHFLDSVRWAP